MYRTEKLLSHLTLKGREDRSDWKKSRTVPVIENHIRDQRVNHYAKPPAVCESERQSGTYQLSMMEGFWEKVGFESGVKKGWSVMDDTMASPSPNPIVCV